MTPPEVLAIGRRTDEPDSPGWDVRVVPNLYAAFSEEGPAYGRHEVIVAGPEHLRSIADLEPGRFNLVMQAFKSRYLELSKDPGIKYIQLIINHGRNAGASLEHPHAQLFAIPIVPEEVERELGCASVFRKRTRECLFCDIAAEERSSGERSVLDEDGILCFCPHASMAPFEMLVMPANHEECFERMEDEALIRVSNAVRRSIRALRKALNDPPYNLYLHTGPCGASNAYHWHIHIVPKLAIAAGFELGTGIYINVVEPEKAAGFLRESASS